MPLNVLYHKTLVSQITALIPTLAGGFILLRRTLRENAGARLDRLKEN